MTSSRTGALELFQDRFARALMVDDVDSDDPGSCAGFFWQPGFAVYRNTVMKGGIHALQANYPSVARITGEEWFRAAAAIFVRRNPPRQPMLVEYGESFAGFLAAFLPAAGVPHLASVARLDRWWTEAHVAPDESPVDPRVVACLDPEHLARALLRPHVSARWACFPGEPVTALWRANRHVCDGERAAQPEWRSEGVLIVRPHEAVVGTELDAAGCAFLTTCAEGRSLAAAAEASMDIDPNTDLMALMARLLAAGAFGELELSNDSWKEQTQ